MQMKQMIQERLISSLSPVELDIINESHLHEGHQHFDNPGETHFKVIISSQQFIGKNKIMRHRAVYIALKECFQQGLHSLTIEASEPN